MRIPEDAWVWAVLIGFALPIFPNEEKNENGEECRFLSIKMVEQMGASAEATFLPFFKLKKPQKSSFPPQIKYT